MWSTRTSMFSKTLTQAGETPQLQPTHDVVRENEGEKDQAIPPIHSHKVPAEVVKHILAAQKVACTAKDWSILVTMEMMKWTAALVLNA